MTHHAQPFEIRVPGLAPFQRPVKNRFPALAARLLSLGALSLLVFIGSSSWILGAEFTYQGRLLESGSLANGNYELRFRLYDQLAGGNQVGATALLTSVSVTNGLFTVNLDFGAAAFSGAPRWLEMDARRSGSVATPELLSPRQPVNPVPYAMFALTTANDAVMQARYEQVVGIINTISNRLQSISWSGLTAATVDLGDTNILSKGYQLFETILPPSWRNGTATGVPPARVSHSAVWDGQSYLVWGGFLGANTYSSSGAAYNPTTDTWTQLTPVGAPTARRGHSAVWTGDAMLIWGGYSGSYLDNGAAYNAGTTTWSDLATLGAPSAREGHGAVWTGQRMVVFGGRNSVGLLGDGFIYDRQGGKWTPLPATGAPASRVAPTVVWTGSQLVVWGGLGEAGQLDSGGILPFTGGVTPGTWSPTSSTGAPSAREGHVAVWTGKLLLVWGGKRGSTLLDDGGILDPDSNTWTPIPNVGAPAARSGSSAVWNGTEMIVFGGETATGSSATGGAYNPATGVWRTLSNGGSPRARSSATAAWTGSEFIIFGGVSANTPIAALQRVEPKPAWYMYRKP